MNQWQSGRNRDDLAARSLYCVQSPADERLAVDELCSAMASGLNNLVTVRLAISTRLVSPASLSTGERQIFASVRGEAAQRRWLRGRCALKMLLADDGLSTDTTFCRLPHPSISLTHSGDATVAVRLSPRAIPAGWRLCGTGVDFEQYRIMQLDAARFFLTASEMQRVANATGGGIENGIGDTIRNRAGDRTAHFPCLLRVWTIKESLFKADPSNECRLTGDYEVMDPWAHSGIACVRKNSLDAAGGSSPRCAFLYTSVSTAMGMLSLAMSLREVAVSGSALNLRTLAV